MRVYLVIKATMAFLFFNKAPSSPGPVSFGGGGVITIASLYRGIQ